MGFYVLIENISLFKHSMRNDMSTKNFIQRTGITAMACGILLFTACHKKDYDFKKLSTDIDWHPSLAAPLAYSTVELSNLITFPDTGDIILQEDSNSFMTLYYSAEIYSASVADLLTLDDQQISEKIGLSDTLVLACAYAQFLGIDSVITLPAYSTTTEMAMPNGAEVDSISLRGGNLLWDISSNFRHDITIDIIIPSATKNGLPYSQNIILDYTGTVPVLYNVNVDLSGYDLDLSAANNGGTANTVSATYSLTVNYDHNESVAITDSIDFSMRFSGLDFENVYGYLGNQVVDIPETSSEFSTGGISMSLVNPKLTLTINNSFGLPIDASFSKLEGGYDGGTISLTGVPNPIEFEYPRVGEEGQSKATVISLDGTNSNLSEFMASGLSSLTFAGSATTNPDGNIGSNFITADGKFSVDMEVELPLYGSISNFGIVDTMDLNLSSLDSLPLASIDFVLNVENEFPFDINVQVYFVDDNFIIIDSLMQSSQKLIESCTVDGNGDLLSATNSQSVISINQALLDNVKNSTKIILVGSIATANNGTTPVKLYSNYKMDFDLGVKANL
jgi:hypothetical protein